MNALLSTSDPLAEILGISEAKSHLRIEHAEEDALIAGLIIAARQAVESWTRRALIEQGFRLALDGWPDGPVRLPRPPLIAVDQVAILAADGAETVLDPQTYRVETRAEPGFLLPTALQRLPSPGIAYAGILIDFRAGFGPDWNAVPEPVRLAVLMLVASHYETRGSGGMAISGAAQDLLQPYRMMSLS